MRVGRVAVIVYARCGRMISSLEANTNRAERVNVLRGDRRYCAGGIALLVTTDFHDLGSFHRPESDPEAQDWADSLRREYHPDFIGPS